MKEAIHQNSLGRLSVKISFKANRNDLFDIFFLTHKTREKMNKYSKSNYNAN